MKPDDMTRVWIRHIFKIVLNPLRHIGYSTNGSGILKSVISPQNVLIGFLWLIE